MLKIIMYNIIHFDRWRRKVLFAIIYCHWYVCIGKKKLYYLSVISLFIDGNDVRCVYVKCEYWRYINKLTVNTIIYPVQIVLLFWKPVTVKYYVYLLVNIDKVWNFEYTRIYIIV